MRAVLLGASLLFASAQFAYAKSERDRDTDDRHDRAERSSSNDHDTPRYGHYDPHPCCGVDPNTYADRDQWTPPQPIKPSSGDLLLRPQVALDHPGGGFAVDIGIPYFSVNELRMVGLSWRFELSYTRWLDNYRPEGARYTSTLDLLRINTGLYYRYTWLSELADVSLAVGPGFTMTRALESFDDGATLNETLIAGVTLGPNLRIDLHGGLFGGRFFVESGVALTAAFASPYLDQYDSLVSGLSIFMITPRAGAGHFWAMSPGVELGVAYDVQTIGSIEPEPTFAHTIYFAMRLFSYVND